MTKVEWNPQAAWHRWVERLLMPLSWRGHRLPVAVTLVWNVVWALVYFIALGGLAFWNFHHDGEGHRQRSIVQARALAETAWSKAQAESRSALPAELPLPVGDPTPALRQLLATPAVAVAFFIQPDGQVTIARHAFTEPAGQAQGLDVERLDPRQITLADTFGPSPPHVSRAIAERRLFHALNMGLVGHLSQTGVFRNGLPASARFAPRVKNDASELPTYYKGASTTGYLGYELAKWELESSLLPEVLKAEGIDDLMGLDPDALAHPLAGQGSVHLYAKDLSRLDRLTDRVVIPGLLLLACLAILRLVAAAQDLRTLWGEREIALAQSNFLSAVSHEMRTPLTTIRMYAEMLEQDVVTDPARRSHYLRTIISEGERLSRLVENVLDHARAGSRHKAYHLEAVNLKDLLEEAVAAVAGPLQAAGMVVELHAPVTLTARLDRDAVVQAVVNLVGNAVKYAAAGGRVVVSALPAGDRVVLTVEDFGPGIAADEQSRVFEPFYRSGSELTRVAPGTGLGLALVAETARAHQGKVELVSDVGRGSAFKLWLPLAPEG